MAGPFDFSSPVRSAAPVDEYDKIRGEWASFLDQPGARAALLSTGIALMQPPSFGDTFASQLGRAVGAGAEAATRGELTESKVAEQEARSSAAVARAGHAGERLSLEQLRQQGMSERQSQQMQIRALDLWRKDQQASQTAYQKALKDWNDMKLTMPAAQMPPQPTPPPFVDFDQWMATKGAGLLSTTVGPGAAGRSTKPPPAVGEVQGGYRFLGGNPRNPQSWEEVK